MNRKTAHRQMLTSTKDYHNLDGPDEILRFLEPSQPQRKHTCCEPSFSPRYGAHTHTLRHTPEGEAQKNCDCGDRLRGELFSLLGVDPREPDTRWGLASLDLRRFHARMSRVGLTG